jgi:glycosyltransferase involved in cell wall biosynthesis
LLTDRYDVQISSFYGVEGAPIMFGDVKVLPGMGGTYGNESLPYHVKRFFKNPRDGMIVTLLDVWVLDAALCSRFNMACWVPVDHDPCPPRVMNFFQGSQAIPLAMSRFGEERLERLDPLYVPHGVDTKVFRPHDRTEARGKLGVPDDVFLVGMVAANKGNPSRKSFVAALEAFAEFRRKHDNAVLYLHTDLEGTFSQGVPLAPVIEALGIPEDAISHPDPYTIHFHPMTGNTMSLVYSAMDVLLNPATGEGFGIPVLEAQACGTPAVVTDFSAMREICGAGWKVEWSKWWTPQHAWQAQPHVGDIVEALDHCYSLSTAAKEQLSEQAREHALQYDVDRVLAEHMLPALERVAERFEERRPLAAVPTLKAAA